MAASVSRILHITDLHFGAKYKSDQSVILTGLKEDLRQSRSGPFAADFLCFSGDVVFSGNEASFGAVFEELLDIADSAGLDSQKIILAPGNHDADTDAISREVRRLDGFRTTLAKSESGNALFEDSDLKSYVSNIFDPYVRFAELFEDNAADSCWPYYCVKNFLDVSFISINTALLTGSGLPGLSDENAMLVPEAALTKALSSVTEGNRVVFVGHHPLEWLAQPNSKRITSLIETTGDAYLFGHVHNAKPTKKTMAHGSIVTNQGGALYQGRDHQAWAGYAIALTCQTQRSWYTKTRRWYENRREFDDATELGRHGEFTTDPAYWRKTIPSLDASAIEQWRQEQLIPFIRANCSETVVGMDIDDVFVAPEFSFETPYLKVTDHQFGSRMKIISYQDIVESDQSFLISAQPEMGKTSTLNQMTLDLARLPMIDSSWTLPVRIDFGAIGTNPQGLMKCIRKAVPSLPPYFELKDMLQSGQIVLLVDDLDFRDKMRRRILFDFVDQYTANRYIFSTSNPIFENAGMHPEISSQHDFQTITMRPLKGSGLAALIEKSKPDKQMPSDKLRERLLREAEVLNVPLTAVTSTLLIQILSSDVAERPMNQAALIDRYLDLLLEKYAAPELDLGTFNYKNKLDLLAAIAEYMVRHSNYHLVENLVVRFIADYLEAFGLEYSAASIFEHLVGTKVLRRKDGLVNFRLRMFLEYFVAYRMQTDEIFRAYVFDPSRYVSFPNEIGLYCALSLKDDEKLLMVFEGYKQVFNRVWLGKKSVDRGGEALDAFQLPAKDAQLDQLDEFTLATRTNEEISDERLAILDDLELEDNQSQEIQRYIPEDETSDWMAHLLLLSGMLKHLELVSNQTKLDVLDSVIDGWLHFTHYSLGVMAQLAKSKRLQINGVTYRSAFPEDMPEGEIARLLVTAMPVAAARMASLSLATEKLAVQLRTNMGSADEPASKSLFKFALLVDLITSEIQRSGPIVLNKVSGSDFLSRAFALKLREIAVRYKLSDDALGHVRQLTADAALASTSGSKRDKQSRRNKIVEGIRRERLLIKFQTKDDL